MGRGACGRNADDSRRILGAELCAWDPQQGEGPGGDVCSTRVQTQAHNTTQRLKMRKVLHCIINNGTQTMQAQTNPVAAEMWTQHATEQRKHHASTGKLRQHHHSLRTCEEDVDADLLRKLRDSKLGMELLEGRRVPNEKAGSTDDAPGLGDSEFRDTALFRRDGNFTCSLDLHRYHRRSVVYDTQPTTGSLRSDDSDVCCDDEDDVAVVPLTGDSATGLGSTADSRESGELAGALA